MSAKFKRSNIVYSTNPDFNDWEEYDDEALTPEPKDQSLYVSLDKKQRKGKKVTLITGFVGSDDAIKELGKVLKSKCGVGGSVKNGEILIQGDFKAKVADILAGMGYQYKLKG